MGMSLAPERLEGESFEEYQMRRANNNARTKVALKGRMFWNSTEQGTYIKAKAAK